MPAFSSLSWNVTHHPAICQDSWKPQTCQGSATFLYNDLSGWCSDKLCIVKRFCYSLIFVTALLKRVLSADCCIWDDCDRWMALLLGFKRMFVSKKEILVTSATQCLIMIASNPKHARVLQLVLRTSHLPPRVLSWRPLAVGMPGLQSVFDDDLSHVWDLWNIAFEICMMHNNNNREFMEHFWRLKVHYSSYSTYK